MVRIFMNQMLGQNVKLNCFCFPIGVADTDQSTGPKMTSVSHPEKVKKTLTADHHHKVIIKFSVKDKASGEKVNF